MVNLKCLFGFHKYEFYGWMKLGSEEIKKQNVDISIPIHRCKRCMRLVAGRELPPKPWPIYVSKDDKIEIMRRVD